MAGNRTANYANQHRLKAELINSGHMHMIVSLPSAASQKKTIAHLFFYRASLFSPACFFPGRQPARFPAPSLDGSAVRIKRLPSVVFACCRDTFFLAHLFFPAGRQPAPQRGGICYFLTGAVCVSGPVLFWPPASQISWLGPGRQTNNEMHVPLG